MRVVRNLFFLVIFIVPFFVSAALGPDVATHDGKELKWEDGARSYHVMFKSTLLNMDTAGEGTNPQADKCRDMMGNAVDFTEDSGNTYTLDMTHVPLDAHVDQAFLVWNGAIPMADAGNPTDNEVTLGFAHKDGAISHSTTVTASRAGSLNDAQDFEFESYKDPDGTNRNYFTYRVDVTDFFQTLHEKGNEAELGFDGMSLFGDYTVSGLRCTSEATFVDNSTAVSGWSLIVVYTSADITAKKIYLYNGFAGYWHQSSDIYVSGFEFPSDPQIRLTMMVAEGDPGNAVVVDPNTSGIAVPESLQVQGDNVDWLQLFNDCNFLTEKESMGQKIFYTEIFNSISSVYGYADDIPVCVGGTPPAIDTNTMEYGMDVDTFVMDSATDGQYAAHFQKGGDHISLKIGANQDWILTNFLIVSLDTKKPDFDIPGEPEKIACGPVEDSTSFCLEKEFYYAIKVQNWGDDDTSAISVQDILPEHLEYVPGTTVKATEFDAEYQAAKWVQIPDKNGAFPLNEPTKVSESLRYCDKTAMTCPDTVMVRFKVKPKSGLPKHTVLYNTGLISAAGSATPYTTNTAIPLRLKANITCTSEESIDMKPCGGIAEIETGCLTNADCGDLQECNSPDGVEMGDCVDAYTAQAAPAITLDYGENAPRSDKIIQRSTFNCTCAISTNNDICVSN